MTAKTKILVFLLFGYSASCIVPLYAAKAFCPSDVSEILHHQESSDFQSPGQASTDSDDNLSVDDERFIELATISFFVRSAPCSIHEPFDILPTGSNDPPFSPPEASFF